MNDLGYIIYRISNTNDDDEIVFPEKRIDLSELPKSLIEIYENPEFEYENGGLIAPNGKASNLTPEQYKLVRTPEFKAWFGDWENSPETASKVVDENGEPLVVYHGTGTDFNIFKVGKTNGIFFTNTNSCRKKMLQQYEILNMHKYLPQFFPSQTTPHPLPLFCHPPPLPSPLLPLLPNPPLTASQFPGPPSLRCSDFEDLG